MGEGVGKSAEGRVVSSAKGEVEEVGREVEEGSTTLIGEVSNVLWEVLLAFAGYLRWLKVLKFLFWIPIERKHLTYLITSTRYYSGLQEMVYIVREDVRTKEDGERGERGHYRILWG